MKSPYRANPVFDLTQIDQVMSRLSSISANVHQFKNALVPINRLPPEVLALVPTFRGSEQDLINATAVCRHWRRTFISTPDLWTEIVSFGQEDSQVSTPHVQAYLERSGSVPIDVQTFAHAFRLFSPHIDRISSLELYLGRTPNLHEIAEHLSKPAPILETVILHGGGWDCPTLVLPSSFVEVLLSSIRTLAFHNAILSPGPYKLSRLTKFTLETGPLPVFPSTVVLDALECMPLLRFLELQLYCPSEQRPVPGDRMVTLPRLEGITITANGVGREPLIIPVLPALCLPRAHRVSIWSVMACGISDAPILPLSFEERLPALSATPRVSVTLGDGFKLESFGPGQSELTLSINTHTRADFTFTQSTFGGTPFGSVRELHVRFLYHNGDSASFIAVLRAMRGLEWLEMEQNTECPLEYWAEVDEQAGICPALIALTITDARPEVAKECFQNLEQARKRAGVPIAHVEIVYRSRNILLTPS